MYVSQTPIHTAFILVRNGVQGSDWMAGEEKVTVGDIFIVKQCAYSSSSWSKSQKIIFPDNIVVFKALVVYKGEE
jgi:hypothetical protein